MTATEGQSPRYTSAVVRGASFTGAGYVLTQVLTLASYVVLARLAGPSVFGTFAAAWILVGVTALFAESGMSAALIQRNDRLEEAAATAVISTLAGGIALTAIALAASPLVGLFFHSREIGLLSAALSGVLFLNGATVVPDALMRRRFSFLRRTIVDPLNALVYGVVGAVALLTGMGVWGLVLATYVAGVIRVIAVWILNRWFPDFGRASFAMWRELASYARHVVASEFLREISGVANTALLGRFVGTALLGEYRFGWRMATQAGIPVAAASTYVLLPAFARIAHDLQRFQNAFLRSVRLLAVLMLPISLALVPLGERLTVTLLGSSWGTAGHVLAALAGVTLALPAIALATEVFKAANRPDLLPRVSLLLTLGMIILLVALLPFGVVAVAGGMSAAYLLAAAYAFQQVGRVLTLSPSILCRPLAGPALASAGMAVVLFLFTLPWGVEDSSMLGRLGWLAASVPLGVAVYASLLRLIAPSAGRELMDAIRIFRGRNLGPVAAQGTPAAQPLEPV
jgi:O-antigen/teichoic acid export membrane protein